MAQVVAIDDGSEVFGDPRDGGRVLRVNWHGADGFVVLSLWRDQLCVATSRVATADVPALIEVLARGIDASAGTGPAATAAPPDARESAGDWASTA